MQFISPTAVVVSAITSVVALIRDPAVVAAISNRAGLQTRDPVNFEVCPFPRALPTALLTPLAQNGTFSKRQCPPSSCDCGGVGPGLFCGGDHAFFRRLEDLTADNLIPTDNIGGCVPGNVYQCNEDGHTTCNFGLRDSCVECGQLSC